MSHIKVANECAPAPVESVFLVQQCDYDTGDVVGASRSPEKAQELLEDYCVKHLKLSNTELQDYVQNKVEVIEIPLDVPYRNWK